MFYCNLLSGPSLLAASFTFEDWSRANLEEALFFFLSIQLTQVGPAKA